MQMSKEKHAFKVAWSRILGGMCELGENRERVCMGRDRTGVGVHGLG